MIYDSYGNLVQQKQLKLQHDFEKFNDFNDDCFNESSTKLIFNSIIPSGIWNDIRYDGYSLPGVSEPYEICQKYGLLACVNSDAHKRGKDVVKSFRYSCKRGTCKKCAEAWANRQAMRIKTRILAYRKNIQQITNHTRNPKSSHCVLSFPEKSNFGSFSEDKKKRILRKVLKKVGSLGGCEIFHPFRFAKQSGFIPRVSPHYHYIIYGWFDEQKIKEVYEKEGVIFKKISTLHKGKDIFGVAKYILSHSGQKKNRHAVKWIGELGYRKLKIEPTLDTNNICEECGEKFAPAKIIHSNIFKGRPPPEFSEPVLVEHGVVELVDFLNGEKIPYYNLDWDVFYKKSESEINATICLEKSIMWNPTAYDSDKITNWIYS